MKLDFLEPSNGFVLGKRFSLENNKVVKHPFVIPKLFTSHTVNVADLNEFKDALIQHADQGHILLRGLLSEGLSNQSRAGKVPSDQTSSWVIVDIDGAPGYEDDPDKWVHDHLPPEFRGVDYIIQYSASYGLIKEKGLCAHLFYLLDEPTNCQMMNSWFHQWNLESAKLTDQIKLAANNMALTYALDIGVNHPSKVLTISKPIIDSPEIVDPCPERIRIETRDKRSLKPNLGTVIHGKIDKLVGERINKLRVAKGLEERKRSIKNLGQLTYLSNPDKCVITGVKEERGFIYLNLNGGDSWSYYFPAERPTLVFNFKGESPVKLVDIAPDFFKEYSERLRENRLTQDTGVIHLAVRDPITDRYWNATYDLDEDRYRLLSTTNSKGKLIDFIKQHDLPEPDFIPDWEVAFRPDADQLYDPDSRFINLYDPPALLRNARPGTVNSVPSTVGWVLDHAFAGDKESLDHFLNWLAVIAKHRVRTDTAWIVQGVEGTGKGLLFSHIARSILGEKYTAQRTVGNLEDMFNSWMQTCLLLNVNESSTGSATQAEKLINQLKNNITEPTLTLRGMGVAQFEIPNYVNYLFTANNTDAWYISATDRRFNVAPRQEQRLIPMDLAPEAKTKLHRRIADMGSELDDFASYLVGHKADIDQAKTALENDAKRKVAVASMTSNEQIFHAWTQGNLKFFLQFINEKPDFEAAMEADSFRTNVAAWTADALRGRPTKMTRTVLRDTYGYLMGTTKSMVMWKFIRQLQLNHIESNEEMINGKPQSVWTCHWKTPIDQIEPYTQHTAIKEKLRVAK